MNIQCIRPLVASNSPVDRLATTVEFLWYRYPQAIVISIHRKIWPQLTAQSIGGFIMLMGKLGDVPNY